MAFVGIFVHIFVSTLECISLIFFSLLFLEKARKTTKKARIFSLLRTLKFLGKKGKTIKKARISLPMKKARKSKKARKRRLGFCEHSESRGGVCGSNIAIVAHVCGDPLSRYTCRATRGQKNRTRKKTNSWERRFPGTFRTNVPLILPIFSVFPVGGGPKVPRNFVPGNFFFLF